MSERLPNVVERKAQVLSKMLRVNSAPDTSVIAKMRDRLNNKLFDLSIADYELMCGNKMLLKMMAKTLKCDEKQLKKFCKYINVFKENINSSPKSIRNKMKPSSSLTQLPDNILGKIVEKYKELFPVKYVLRDWVPIDKLNWESLSKNRNPNCIDFLRENIDKIKWDYISANPIAIELLEENYENIDWNWLSENPNPKAIELLKIKLKEDPDYIDWERLSVNPNAVKILKEYPKNIDWDVLTLNPSSEAIEILRTNPSKIDWWELSANPSDEAIKILKENPDNIEWEVLSANPSDEAIKLLKENPDNIDWDELSRNPNPKAIKLLIANPEEINCSLLCLNTNPKAIEILKENLGNLQCAKNIDWYWLSGNSNPKAIEILKANPKKIDWDMLSGNPNAIELLKDNPKKINWEKLCENPSIFEKEFIDDNSYDSEDNEIVLDSFAKVQDIIHMPFNNETKNKNLVKSLFKKPIEYETGLNRLKEYFANTSEQHNIYVNYYHNILRQINAIKQHVNFPNLNNFDYKYYNKNKRFYKFDPKFNSDAKENTERQKDAQYIENEVIREFKTIIIYSQNNRNSDDIIRNLEINKPKYIALQFIASLIRFNNTNVTQINILNKTIMILDILIAKRIALNDDNSMSVSKSISWSGTPKSNADDFQSKANIEKYKVTKAALIKEITENNLNDSDPFSGEEWADMPLNKLKKVISITSVINSTTYRHAFYVRTLYQFWRVSEKSLDNKVKFLNPYNRVPFTEDDKTAIMDAMITMYPRLERPRQGKGRQDISYNFYTGTINRPDGMFYSYATFNFSYILKFPVGEDILIPLATHIQIRLDFDEELDNAYIPNVLFENIKYLMENKKMFGKNMPIKMLDVLKEYDNKKITTMMEYKDFFDKIKNAL